MWPRQQKTVILDSFAARLKRVEADCLRRLDFVEAQLRRAGRSNRRWDAHMTVVDADIEPVGRLTHFSNRWGDPRSWPWWLYAVVGIGALALVIGFVSAF